jgi:hypothetical protein
MSSQDQPQAHLCGTHAANGVQRARIAQLEARVTVQENGHDGQVDGGVGAAVNPGQPPPARRAVRVIRSSKEVRPAPRRSGWVYVKHALMHPWHVVVLAGATVFGVANWSLLVLLLVFAGAELLLLGIVLHLRAFRRYVDERLDQIERAKAAEQRATLLLQMGDEHRRELLRLEAIVDHIRDGARPHGTAAQIAVDECLRLLASYVRLAIAYNVSRECLASVDRRHLEEEIRSLEAARFSQSPHARALAQRRLVIARKRTERWDRSRDALEAIAHQLAMIGELVQLTHEQVVAPADPGTATDEIDRVVEELDDTQSTIEELAEFLGVEETIEPSVLELGRAARV